MTLNPFIYNPQHAKSSAELANALQYARADFVTRIYDPKKDEFTPCMTETVNLTFNGIHNSLCEKTGRIFSLCGAHLIAMFANTPVAKEFRKWCLDILDKEVGVPEHQPQSPEVFNGNDLNNLA
ncbi:hypothetical protein BJP41_08645 [Candidatus Williamhamiltonella defendens]|uniref:Bro-N domain-containing protein n=1 Tax=Candidatus Williamhamiltonella defendens TaxID=138072 RepID=A0A2D3T9A6_9ENTR|nr:hypothetical protein [Candidatus Hamiltonella defensa]ATW30373.1 hypothetical protein BJP41_08645 [Candidatus Hamiltonella defensa]ATW32386.1 hypothetical protein BJP42_08950 [Candidatus Hamiltonella defensa]